MEVIINQPSITCRMFETRHESSEDYERRCHVCSAPSNGYHFNAPSCSACAAFFRRTVTLNRKFECSYTNDCRINYAMRVICRSCRYKKCIEAGMDRRAVQPRRDSIMGRRKIKYIPNEIGAVVQTSWTYPKVSSQYASADNNDKNFIVLDVRNINTVSKDVLTAVNAFTTSTDSSNYVTLDPNFYVNIDQQTSALPQTSYFTQTSPTVSDGSSQGTSFVSTNASTLPPSSPTDLNFEPTIQFLLNEEAKSNERRKILYSERYLSELLSDLDSDLPFSKEDLRPLKFMLIQKEMRPMILITVEWLRGWPYFGQLNIKDKTVLLRCCVLYHAILDPAWLTVCLGYPTKFVMQNGMYVSMTKDSKVGWEDEKDINAETKEMLYKPLMERIVAEIVEPMRNLDLSHTEYCAFKALVCWKGSYHLSSNETRELLNKQIDALFESLDEHYRKLSYDSGMIAERTGNMILLVANVFSVGLEAMENHHKIDIFDLWQLDSLLLRLLKFRK
uniref:Nuclear receptor domain-containing protein n=1 Tax=Panagrellus redivivus TaxID=6233 RepID=A0A7E4ZS26_PANRE